MAGLKTGKRVVQRSNDFAVMDGRNIIDTGKSYNKLKKKHNAYLDF